MDIGRAKASVTRRPKRKRVGRGSGSGHGKTSGRGQDGARSRSGWSSRGLTGGAAPLWRRLPKRGFSNAPFKTEPAVVNVGRLERFEDGAVVGPEEMHRAGLIKRAEAGGVKILGEGELRKALTVRANAFSRSAIAKIEAAGGKVEPIQPPKRPVRNPMRSPYSAERT
jgi:large subunit ribosomal protein L15